MSPVQFQFVASEGKASPAQNRCIRSHAAIQAHERRKVDQRVRIQRARPTLDKLCTCNFQSNSSSPFRPSGMLPETVRTCTTRGGTLEKQQRIADSYKICVRCREVQYVELSGPSQVAVMSMVSPHINTFCQAEFDPFSALPELRWRIQPGEVRALNEVKYFSESV